MVAGEARRACPGRDSSSNHPIRSARRSGVERPIIAPLPLSLRSSRKIKQRQLNEEGEGCRRRAGRNLFLVLTVSTFPRDPTRPRARQRGVGVACQSPTAAAAKAQRHGAQSQPALAASRSVSLMRPARPVPSGRPARSTRAADSRRGLAGPLAGPPSGAASRPIGGPRPVQTGQGPSVALRHAAQRRAR